MGTLLQANAIRRGDYGTEKCLRFAFSLGSVSSSNRLLILGQLQPLGWGAPSIGARPLICSGDDILRKRHRTDREVKSLSDSYPNIAVTETSNSGLCIAAAQPPTDCRRSIKSADRQADASIQAAGGR